MASDDWWDEEPALPSQLMATSPAERELRCQSCGATVPAERTVTTSRGALCDDCRGRGD